MIKLTEKHKKQLQYHGGRVSQKLTDAVHKSHFHKIILHTKREEPFLKFPLLLGIILTLLFPLFIGIGLVLLFLSGGNLIVEKDE